jgi:hypothetical protein
MICPLCRQRPGQRACPARGAAICSQRAFLDTATRVAARLGPPPGARSRSGLIVEP